LSTGTSMAFLLLVTPCQRDGMVEVATVFSPCPRPAPMLSAMFDPPFLSKLSSLAISSGLLPSLSGILLRSAKTGGDLVGECLEHLGGGSPRLVKGDRLPLDDRFLEIGGDGDRGREDRRTVVRAEELLEALMHCEPRIGHGDQESE